MNEYINLLPELKKVELDILKAFIQCCETLKVQYFLMDGTLLGAVRHGGFIPWDDDIDVGMLRGEYETFVSRAQKILPKHYFLQTIQTDKEYLNNFAKIRDSRTTFIEKSQSNRNINHGIYIDIFPIDFYPDHKSQQILFRNKNRLLSLRIRREYSLPYELRKTAKYNFIRNIMSGMLCVSYPSVRSALISRDKLLKSVKKGKYVCNFCGGYGYKSLVPHEWFEKVMSCSFEGIDVSIPVGYKQYLTAIYGDFMKLPPVEKRMPHHYAEIIDVRKPYSIYTNKGELSK